MPLFLNVVLSALLISFALWVSKKNPVLGGFIVSLPLSTLIILALNQLQGSDERSGFVLVKSIFVGIPATLVFFIPFLLADRLRLGFWSCYFLGFAFLGLGFYIHRFIMAGWGRL